MKPLLEILRRNLTLFALGTLCSVSAILTPARAEDPYVLWATTGPSSGGVGSSVLDLKGELHVIPSFAPSFSSGLAILRFDPEGRLVSTNRFEGLLSYQGRLTIDRHGNSYLTGMIKTNGYFDTSQVHGFFTAKFSPDDELLWVRSQGLGDIPNVQTYGSAITVDDEGSVFVGGVSQGPMTLGPLSLGEGGGPFICKYDRDGQVLWVKRIEHQGSPADQRSLNDLSVDPTGHIVITGTLSDGSADFGGTTVFPGSTGHSYGGDWYLARFKADGDLHWVQLGYGGASTTDKRGDIYARIAWSKDVSANGLAKFSPTGDLLWSKTFPGAYVEWPGSIALDPDGEPVFTGQFEGTAQFDSITLSASSTGYGDIFVAKTDAQGNIQWAMSGGGLKFDRGEQVVCDAQGNIFLTGVITGTGSLGGFPLVGTVDGGALFAAKLNNPAPPPLNIKSSIANVTLSWPIGATSYVLEAAMSLPAVSWDTVTNIPTVMYEHRVQLPITGTAQFFRLRRP